MAASDPTMVIEVLQRALRASLQREHELKLQLAQKDVEADIAKRKCTVQMEEEATQADAAIATVEFEAATHRENRPETDGSNSVITAALDFVCGAGFCEKCAADPVTPVLMLLCAVFAVIYQSWMIRIMLLLLMFGLSI